MNSELHDIVRRARNLAPTTKALYLRDLDQWIEFAGEDSTGWTRLRAQDFYDHLIDQRGLRAQSANRVIASLRFASKWRAQLHGRPELDFAFIQTAKADQFDPKRALTQEEVIKLLAPIVKATDPIARRDLAIIGTLLETGMRKSSLISMHFEKTRLEINERAYPATQVRMKGRGKREVEVPLSDVACDLLARWRTWCATRGVSDGPVFRGVVDKLGSRSVEHTLSDRALASDSINKILTKRSADVGIEHVFPHQFRHTFITWRVLAGIPLHEIAVITGHTIRGMDVMQGYMDEQVIAQKVRNSTPAWLRELIQ